MTEYQKLQNYANKHPEDLAVWNALFEYSRTVELDEAKPVIKSIQKNVLKQTHATGRGDWFELYWKSLLLAAPWDLDSYLLYVERHRAPQERFYQPRRRILKRVVDCLQRLADDELDELFLTMPPRVGKTTILMFFCTWIIGRDPEASNLYSAYSDLITNAFYRGVLEILTDPSTYTWADVFPTAKLRDTSAREETINIDRKKRYPSLTCRSLYGTLNGACDCKGMLISDDLIGSIEEALSKDRMTGAWLKVDNNLIPRAKEHAKLLWCGTRWSLLDPMGLRMDLLQNDDQYSGRRFEVIDLPALNENDESQFDYDFGVGFTSEFYRQRRASFERNNDLASWSAQYMCEPIEREGTLFSPEDMLTYNGVLPDREPDRIFMAVDPAFGGGDFVAAPIVYQYDSEFYVHDVLYNNGDKTITRPLLIEKIKKHKVQAAQFEANKSTAEYKEWVEDGLKEEGYRLNITTKPAPQGKAKEIRIFDKAPEIRELHFLEQGKRHKEYSMFMQNLYSFKINGKNKTDDAPDSLAMVIDMIRGVGGGRARVFSRPF